MKLYRNETKLLRLSHATFSTGFATVEQVMAFIGAGWTVSLCLSASHETRIVLQRRRWFWQRH